jgi:hypothetical protein
MSPQYGIGYENDEREELMSRLCGSWGEPGVKDGGIGRGVWEGNGLTGALPSFWLRSTV